MASSSSSSSSERGGGKHKYFIGNLPSSATEEDLEKAFSEYGKVTKSLLPRRDGHSRGFGFVTFAEAPDGALFNNRITIHHREVVVRVSIPEEELPPHTSTRPERDSRESKDQCKLFVGGLPREVTAERLESVFGEYGAVTQADVRTDRLTGESRGFGFVRFKDPADAAHALKYFP
eukprot:RCo039700